jgi:ankyrin repeat protein
MKLFCSLTILVCYNFFTSATAPNHDVLDELVAIAENFKSNNCTYSEEELTQASRKLDILCNSEITLSPSSDWKEKYARTSYLDTLFNKYGVSEKQYLLAISISELRFLLLVNMQKLLDKSLEDSGFQGMLTRKMKVKTSDSTLMERIAGTEDLLLFSIASYVENQKKINQIKTNLLVYNLNLMDQLETISDKKRCLEAIKRMLSAVSIERSEADYISVEELPLVINIGKGDIDSYLKNLFDQETSEDILSELSKVLAPFEELRRKEREKENIDHFMKAACLGDTAKITDFFLQGFDITTRDDNGKTVVYYAVSCGQTDLLKLLIAHGAETNITFIDKGFREYSEVTYLMKAAGNGHTEVVRILIENGAKVNKVNSQGFSAIHYASTKGSLVGTVQGKEGDFVNTINLLIESGADVNAKNRENKTCLIRASNCGFDNIVEALLAHGADVNARDKDNYTALIFACINGNLETVKLLMEHGADPKHKNNKGNTALMEARRSKRDIYNYLVSLGVKE